MSSSQERLGAIWVMRAKSNLLEQFIYSLPFWTAINDPGEKPKYRQWRGPLSQDEYAMLKRQIDAEGYGKGGS